MASTIGKVRAVFTASTSGLTSGVNQAAGSMRRMESQIGGLSGQLRLLNVISGAQLFGSIASGASRAVRSLVSMGQAQAEVVDQTSKLAARLGLTYSELAGISLAGELAGVSMDQIGAAVTRADVAFVKATNGSKQARAAFAQMGLSVEQLGGMSAAERFKAISDAIAAIPDPASRAAAAVQIFGRAGAQLLPLFSQGAGAIQQASAEAERFGLALTNAQGQDVEEMNDAFTRAQAAIRGVVQQVVAYLAPAIQAVTDTFSNLIGGIGGANIGQFIGEGILTGARYLAEVGDYIIQSMPAVWEYVRGVGQYWSTVFEGGQRVFDFFAYVGRLIESVFKFVGSLLIGTVGRLMNSIGELMQFIPGMASAGRGIEQAGERLMRTSTQLWEESGAALEAAAENAANSLFGRVEAEESGEAMAGPLTSALDAALAQAQRSAAQIDKAGRNPIQVQQQLDATEAAQQIEQAVSAPLKEAVRGIDSRSSEGIREMFRIMRGDTGNNVEERQLSALERIADNTEDIDVGVDDFDVVDLAPAAGA